MIEFQVIVHLGELKGGRLMEKWALIRGGAYLIIMCLGWGLIEGRLIEAYKGIKILVSIYMHMIQL